MNEKKNKSLLFRLFADNDSDKDTVQDTAEQTNDTGTVKDEQQQAQERIADLLYNEIELPPEPEPQPEPVSTEPELDAEGKPLPVPAQVTVICSPSGMHAYVEVSAPMYGGADVNPRSVRTAITDAGISYGILDKVLFDMAINKPYGKGRVLVAQGTPKQDGQDSIITEHFARELDLTPFRNNDGTVDFKELNIVREVAAGTVIVSATPPTPGQEGVTVRGERIPPVQGKPKTAPRGTNTILSEDGLTLTAAATGNLRFDGERFNVDTTFVVEGSVDNNTGNISFYGDVLIKGDIREGYEIRSQKGGIKVKGIVEGASLYADGDIVMDGGCNGMKRGEVVTNGSITSKFLQNCNVSARGKITAEAIINSIVDCDDVIVVTRGKGTVVGGKVTALHAIEVNTIGSDVNTPTSINVGLSPTIIEERQTLEKELKEVEDAKEAQYKNLIYLERCSKMGPLSPKNLALVETCNKQKVIILMREGKCTRRLAEVNAIIEEAAEGSYVKAKLVYPSTKITIQNISFMTKMVYNRSIFRREQGEIKLTGY